MGGARGPDGSRKPKPWTTLVLGKIDLTDEEAAALRATDDPLGPLFELKLELGRKVGK